ncbi:anaphase-promoting complex, cyclosome, subunit 4-domain-containing protein [Trichophaea hybrida]|nr:anaphase-promoting complex, cyclosome, subunit 4-domain-containing protein [Trichophaea hybrida]
MEGGVSEPGSAPAPGRGFRPLHQGIFPVPVREGLAAWSPLLDLIAIATTGENVYLYRMNGQRVWGVTHKLGNKVTVEELRWRPDGKMLALGYSDGSTRIYDVNNGKAIHCITSEASGFGKITCLGWVDNHSRLNVPGRRIPETKSAECTPQALFDLDIGVMLPRLSVLPSSAGPESTFTSKTTLDALINAVTKGGEGSHLDVLLIAEEGGKILLNVFESFLIGTMDLSSLTHQLEPGSKLIRHAASFDLSTHSLLLHEPKMNHLLFSTMDILFIQQFGQYLFQLASTSTRVQALIRYMRETVTTIETEFKIMNDLTQKFVGIIAEDAENVGSEVGLEFFEFLVTGGPSPTLKEWLMDTLTERGQKRWEKSSVNGYETLRRLVHENLLPTCERLSVLFCRLRGLARWKESGSPLGLEPDDFTRCLEVVSAITLYVHEFLSKVNKELDLYKAFMNWLRYALDQLSTVINIDDKPTEDPQVDTLKVAEFVGNYIKKSSLLPFLARNIQPKLSTYKERGESIIELYSKNEKSVAVPGFMDLAEYLEGLCKTVFSKPQQSMREQLRLSRPVLISEDEIVRKDIWMVENGQNIPLAYMFLHPGNQEDEKFVLMIRCEIDTTGGLSSASKIGCAKVAIQLEQELVDMQFIDDNLVIMVILNRSTGIGELVSMDYANLQYDEGYNPTNNSWSICSYAGLVHAQEVIPTSRRTFDAKWVPAQVIVNGKEGRRVGCVVAKDSVRYSVFDLDHEDEDEEDEGDKKNASSSMEVDSK